MPPTQVIASMQVVRLLGSRRLLDDNASEISCSMSGNLDCSRAWSSLQEVDPARGAIIWHRAWKAMPLGRLLLDRTLSRWSVHGSRYESTNFSGANSDIFGIRLMTCCFTLVCLESRKLNTVSTVCLYLQSRLQIFQAPHAHSLLMLSRPHIHCFALK
jgi:hypothetical protein